MINIKGRENILLVLLLAFASFFCATSMAIATDIAEFQSEVLDIAFDIATRVPVQPHIKSRSKAQQDVILTFIELGQIQKAAKNCELISNWRKGVCYAEVAMAYATNKDNDNANKYINLAQDMIENQELEPWRSDQIRVRIEKTKLIMGNDAGGEAFEDSLVESQAGKLLETKATLCDEASYSSMVKELDDMISTGVFDIVKNSLYAYANLYSRFYENMARREVIENKIKSSWKPIPYFFRIELLYKIANSAIVNGDMETASRLIEEALSLLVSDNWRLENKMPLQAKGAILLFQAGQTEKATEILDAEIEFFKSDKKQIVNIYRQEALTPIAEAYLKIGNMPKAREVYALAIDESFVNPNFRPRAEDIVSICCSMAVNNVELDSTLLKKVEQLLEGQN